MTITELPTGIRHRLERIDTDQRIAWMACGERVAFGSRPLCPLPDCPNHPPAPKTTDCAGCRS